MTPADEADWEDAGLRLTEEICRAKIEKDAWAGRWPDRIEQPQGYSRDDAEKRLTLALERCATLPDSATIAVFLGDLRKWGEERGSSRDHAHTASSGLDVERAYRDITARFPKTLAALRKSELEE